ncbi:MAG: HD domain-containing protein, partial [Chloroflexi bacterium]|nr:HD domain-containing protein [Chloroflexota bacterium]
HHHERWDGAGYPERLAREHIPLGARIIAVADAYHAMTSDRPYRTALSRARALQVLEQEAGKQFDPELVRLFLQLPEDALCDTIELEDSGGNHDEHRAYGEHRTRRAAPDTCPQ